MIPYRKQFKKKIPGFLSSIQSFIQDGVNKQKNKISDSINIHTISNIRNANL